MSKSMLREPSMKVRLPRGSAIFGNSMRRQASIGIWSSVEPANRGDDFVDLIVGDLRVHRQRQDGLADARAYRKRIGRIPQVAIGILKMYRNGIMDERLNPFAGKVRLQAIALIRLNDE